MKHLSIKRPVSRACLFALLIVSGCAANRAISTVDSGAFMFALIGDMPYGPTGIEKFHNLQEEINRDPGIEWVLHVGDIKTGAAPCSDELLQERFSLFQAFTRPFVFTPGDNEWTDCHRAPAGQYDPLERLAALRELFYPVPGEIVGGAGLSVVTQAADDRYAEFPENVLWSKEGVVFSTLHVVGSLNGMAPFTGRTRDHDEEARRRMEAAISWMQSSFAEAHRLNSPGIFLMIHANPGFSDAPDVYVPFLEALERETVRFGRPVLLAHGDSHYFRIDKPLIGSRSGSRIENFTRVETFGAGDIHWLRITVDPSDANVFTIRQKIVDANREQHGSLE